MQTYFSDNEIDFFNRLLFDYEIRIDGRDKIELRNYKLEQNIIKTTLSSCKITYNNNKNEIIFAIKGELIPNTQSLSKNDIININIDSMSSQKTLDSQSQKAKNQIETLIKNMIISNLDTSKLIVINSKPELIWKIYIDLFIFDQIKLSIFQMITLGINHLLRDIKLPKILTFYNEVTEKYEYDLKNNYEEITEEDSEYNPGFELPNIYCFSVINNKLYLDPTNEEWDISNCIIFIAEYKKEIMNVESVGESVNPLILLELNKVVKQIGGEK